ncbi:hypothetical protein K490DRAFT_65760 [Saccharata proteae CBS 121410]|uniref:ABM domain-containing protein n=1 Tax=Saccharata proteae CBS 121410 TaxID=1314787 RepID=A0A9P4HSV0_9PEZI|nr:hypothetical protein K490DRAFT_65760 [Saccharata proteae CBS 121410]
MAPATPTIQTGEGVTLIVEFNIAPESLDLFLSHFKHAVELASAEPECMSFQNQLTKPYMTAYIKATQPLWAEERSAEVWERMEGSFWMKARESVFEKI